MIIGAIIRDFISDDFFLPCFPFAFNAMVYLDMDESTTIGGGIADNLPVFANFAKLPRRASRTET